MFEALSGFIVGVAVSGFFVFLMWRYKKIEIVFKKKEKELNAPVGGGDVPDEDFDQSADQKLENE